MVALDGVVWWFGLVAVGGADALQVGAGWGCTPTRDGLVWCMCICCQRGAW
jgi:hypothetical protein